MQLTIKDLKQNKFAIEVEPSDTVASLKEKIATEKGWEASSQKLIHSGKILADANTIQSYNIEEKGFVVCMVSKPKTAPAPKPVPSTPAPVPVSTPAAPSQSTSSGSATNPPATPSPAGGAPATTGGQPVDPEGSIIGTQRNAAIADLEAMGFPRAEAERAFRAAFYNQSRAVEYLLQGIPEHVQAQQMQPANPAATSAATTQATAQAASDPQLAPPTTTGAEGQAEGGDEGVNLFEQAAAAQASGQGGAGGLAGMGGMGALGGGAGGAAPPAGMGSLEAMRNNPQIQALRQLVAQNPQMIQPILQQLGASNPGFAQWIQQHPDQFLQLLSPDGDEEAYMPPDMNQEDEEAIQRLCRLGFDRGLAMEAYLACDKNEELAANFLFDQPPEEMDNPPTQ